MKILLISFLSSLLFTASAPYAAESVYVCNGKSSKKYHLKENCKGLTNCSTEIEKVTLREAKNKGRTLCGFED